MQLAELREQLYNEYLSLQNDESALSYFVASFEAYSQCSQIISFIDFAEYLDKEISNKVVINENRFSVGNNNHLVFINNIDIDYGYNSIKFNVKDHWYIFSISFQLSQHSLKNFEETRIKFPLIIESPYQNSIKEETKLRDYTYFRNPKLLDFPKRLFSLSYKDYQIHIKDLSEFFKVYNL